MPLDPIEQQRHAIRKQLAQLQEELDRLENASQAEGRKLSHARFELLTTYREEASFFQMLFNTSTSAVLLLDDRGLVISANASAVRFFDVPLERMQGEEVIQLFQFYRINTAPLKEVFEEGSGEVSYKAWGTGIQKEDISCQIVLRGSASKGRQLYVCICSEIEPIQDLEQIVRHSLMQLQEALKHARTFAITIDRDKTITYCNDFLLQITGWKAEELLGKSLLNVFTPFTANEEFVRVKGFLDTFEGILYTHDDRELTVRFNSIVMNDSHGDLAVMTIVGEDITEQVRISQELKRTNELLQEVFNTTNDLILIFQHSGHILYANNACLIALGYDEEEVRDMKVRDFVNPDQYEDTYEKLRVAVEQGEYKNFETVFISREGQKIHLMGDVTCTRDPRGQQPVTVRAILHNYTDQLKAKNSQKLYYSLARLVEQDPPLQELYQQIHMELEQVMPIDSIIIAVQESSEKPIMFPYFVNSGHTDGQERIQAMALAKYSITLRKPTLLTEHDIHRMILSGELPPMQNIPKVWMAVPLILKRRTVGVILVQSFKYAQDHSEKDLELLSFISGQITSAIVREQNEEKIYRQAARLGAIFESGNHLMWSINRRGQLTQFNKQFAESLWHHYQAGAAENIIFRNFYAPPPNKSLDFWRRMHRDAFKGNIQQFPISFVGENGSERWYEVSINPIFAPNGRVAEVAGVANDITQKKIIELDLYESESKFRTIFESFQDVYFRTDMDGIINMVSPSVFELMGEAESEVLGKSVTEYYLSQSKLQYLRKVLLEEGSVKNFESTLIDKNNRTKIIISNFRLIYSAEGLPSFIEGVARDITELKRATEELRKAKNLAEKSLEVKKRFLSNMSHEIRTPMNGIIGMIDLLAESPLDREQLHYVNTVKKSSETLLTILNDILDLSKMEAGKMRIRKTPTDLHRTLDKLQALFAQKAQSKATELVCELAHDMPQFVMADETRLLQVLSNLTSNAIKFTENGTITISAHVEEVDGRDYQLRFSVSDTGIGISEDDLDLLFRQFSQVDNSYTKAHGGTGLGLAISQELSRMMGGQIGVTSRRHEGSTFWFTIAARACTPEEVLQAKQQQQPAPVQRLQDPHRLLVVDDNLVNLQVAQGILEKAKCVVVTARSGQQALELLEREPFDMIFMDIQMPVMNGLTATKLARERLGEDCPPVVAMTAFSLQEEREEFLGAGMDDFIAKPIKAQELIGMVRRWLEPEEGEEKMEKQRPDALPEPPPEPETPIVNLDTAAELGKYGGQEILASVYGDFEQETNALMNGLKQAIGRRDWKTALGHLHTIKGSAGTLGIDEMALLSKEFEAALKHENYMDADAMGTALQQAFFRYQKHYRAILGLSQTEQAS